MAAEESILDEVEAEIIELAIDESSSELEELDLAIVEIEELVPVSVKLRSIEGCDEVVLSSLVGEELLIVDASEVRKNDELGDRLLDLPRSLETAVTLLELGGLVEVVEEAISIKTDESIEDVLKDAGPDELVKEAKSVDLDESIRDMLEERSSVLIGPEELVEEGRSVELDESIKDVLGKGFILIGSDELPDDGRSVELDESNEDVLEEGSVLIGPEEPADEARSVELDESAEVVVERPAEDEEPRSVLAILETLESVKLMEEEESELTVALVDRSVGDFDILAVMLGELVLDTPSAVDERELTAGETKDMLAEDGIPVSTELEIVDDAEVGLKIEVREDGPELSREVEVGLEVALRTLVAIKI